MLTTTITAGQIWVFICIGMLVGLSLGILFGLLLSSIVRDERYADAEFVASLFAAFLLVLAIVMLWVYAVMGGWLNGDPSSHAALCVWVM